MHKIAPRLSVFEKFGGIRPMASALGLAHSTVKAWHYAKAIPSWRHDAILRAAEEAKIKIAVDELTHVRGDSTPFKRGAPSRVATEKAA